MAQPRLCLAAFRLFPLLLASTSAAAVQQRLVLVQSPANGTVAGATLVPAPLLQLVDANGSRVSAHEPELAVVAEYEVIAYTSELTGGASAAVARAPGTPIVQTRGATVPLVNGSADFAGALTITYATDALRLVFHVERADGTALSVLPLVAPPISIVAAAPTALVVLHDPAGGLHCNPFAQQPRLAVKDAFNNTVSVGLPALSVRASLHAVGGIGVTGSELAAVSDGVATFESLGVNETGLRLHLAFDLTFADGSERAAASAIYAERGVWEYTHETDPLLAALTLGVLDVLFMANLTHYLPYELRANGSSCCTLRVPRADVPGETIEDLYVPPLAIARLTARNSGHQGGYGTGDTIELTFATRTDRAGFAVGELLEKATVDALLFLDTPLGSDTRAYAGVWRDDCTLLLIAGNTTGAEAPTTGVFTLRLRDDNHAVRDKRRQIQVGSVATSPPLEGTFGAAVGRAGRLDPLRQALPDLAARRHIPQPYLTVDYLRTGPMRWHPPRPFDPTHDRRSECDAEILRQEPDGRPGAPAEGQLPPYTLDATSRALIREAVAQMAREAPSGLPFTQPPAGLPTDAEHDHDAGDAPPSLPWTPSDAAKQHAERSAAAAIGPNGAVQRYTLTLGNAYLSKAEHEHAFGLE